MYAYAEESPFMGTTRRAIDPRSPEAVGSRLKAYRLGLGLTQAEMVRRLGSRNRGQTWANYEAGQIPSRDMVFRIARVFSLDVLWIYQGSGDRLTREQDRIVQLGELRIQEGWRTRGPKKKEKSAN